MAEIITDAEGSTIYPQKGNFVEINLDLGEGGGFKGKIQYLENAVVNRMMCLSIGKGEIKGFKGGMVVILGEKDG